MVRGRDGEWRKGEVKWKLKKGNGRTKGYGDIWPPHKLNILAMSRLSRYTEQMAKCQLFRN